MIALVVAVKAKQDTTELEARGKALKEAIGAADARLTEIETARDAALAQIGNLVHDSVPIDDDEVRECQHATLSQEGLWLICNILIEDVRCEPVCPANPALDYHLSPRAASAAATSAWWQDRVAPAHGPGLNTRHVKRQREAQHPLCTTRSIWLVQATLCISCRPEARCRRYGWQPCCIHGRVESLSQRVSRVRRTIMWS